MPRYNDSADSAKQIKDAVAQASGIKDVEIKSETTITYKIPIFDKDNTEELITSYNSSCSAETYIELCIKPPVNCFLGDTPIYIYGLSQEGNSIKLKYFKNLNTRIPLPPNDGQKKLSKNESDKINKAIDLMIKKTPQYTTILNYIKQKNKPGEVVPDK